jgi:hypothetical protein
VIILERNITLEGGGGGQVTMLIYMLEQVVQELVILRMPTVNYSGTTTGSPTVTIDGTDTILVFNASGSYTG